MEKPSIESVLEFYQVHGRQKMISCPFHEDRNPSCSVDYGEGVFHCFSCGEGGDSLTLIEKLEGLSFTEAVEFAEKFGTFKKAPEVSELGTRYGGLRNVQREGDRRDRRAYRPSWRN